MTKEIQTRSEELGVEYFETVTQAMEYASRNPSVWKISFSLLSGERVRLVKRDMYSKKVIDENDLWIYESVLP